MKGLSDIGWNLTEGRFEEFFVANCTSLLYPAWLLRKVLSAHLKISAVNMTLRALRAG
jgi:hypothetical protein